MVKYFWLVLLSLILSPSSPALADNQLSLILEGIRNKYGPLPGFAAPYTREIISKSMAMLGEPMKTDLATGQIFFKPPHFLKVQQKTPKPEIVITDGHLLWWYLPHKKQVYKYPSSKLGQELRLLSNIFQGLREVSESFEVILIEPENTDEHHIKLIPNPPWPQVDHINLSVLKGDYRIRIVGIHNHLGGITRFILEDLTVKENLKENYFKFVAPEGVTVIEE